MLRDGKSAWCASLKNWVQITISHIKVAHADRVAYILYVNTKVDSRSLIPI